MQYVPELPQEGAVALDELCESAHTVCAGLGAWAKRLVRLIDADADAVPWIGAETGGWGAVEMGVPPAPDPVERARWALGALAFSSSSIKWLEPAFAGGLEPTSLARTARLLLRRHRLTALSS